jgi:hypothetical protein
MLTEDAEAEDNALRISMVMTGGLARNRILFGTLRTGFQSHGRGSGFEDWLSFGTIDWVNQIVKRNSFLPNSLGRLICLQRRGRDSNPWTGVTPSPV